jgi:hypothetical protein
MAVPIPRFLLSYFRIEELSQALPQVKNSFSVTYADFSDSLNPYGTPARLD